MGASPKRASQRQLRIAKPLNVICLNRTASAGLSTNVQYDQTSFLVGDADLQHDDSQAVDPSGTGGCCCGNRCSLRPPPINDFPVSRSRHQKRSRRQISLFLRFAVNTESYVSHCGSSVGCNGGI
jgi:hypothetical protein